MLLAPVPTQFLLHARPWPGLPSVLGSSAGALSLTRCGRDRISLLTVLVEMRSPRAVLHAVVSTGDAAPASLSEILPERDSGLPAPLGEPGPAPARAPLAERLQRFELDMRHEGALSVDAHVLSAEAPLRLVLQPGCHQLLVTQADAAPSYRLELHEREQSAPRRLEPSEQGDVRDELCAARERSIAVELTAGSDAVASGSERKLAIARFALPHGLPARFGADVAERVARALGGSTAPRRLGPLVLTTLGAQGHTPLPRRLLPRTCYLAVAAAVHGEARSLSLGVQTGAHSAEAGSGAGAAGPRLAFCTGSAGEVAFDVEARGLGMAWLLLVFQVGRAEPEHL